MKEKQLQLKKQTEQQAEEMKMKTEQLMKEMDKMKEQQKLMEKKMLDSMGLSKSSSDQGKIKPVKGNVVTSDLGQVAQIENADDIVFRLTNNPVVVNTAHSNTEISQKLSLKYSKSPNDIIIYPVKTGPRNDIKISVK